MFASPLKIGAGIKVKLLEAMALGLPIVASSVAVEGIGAAAGVHYLEASSGTEFAEAIEFFLREPAARVDFGRRARELVLTRFDEGVTVAQIDRALQA